MTIVSTTRVVSNGTDVNTISGPVTGGGTLVKAGTGTLVLTNAGNAGNREVRGGTLRVAAGALGTTGDLILGHGTTLAVTGNNSLAASRSLFLGFPSQTTATATIDVAANQTFTVAGLVTSNSGLALGALVKTGAGSLALTNGGVIFLGGRTLELNGGLLVNNGTVSGTTNVNAGAVAKGAGTYGVVNVNQGGVYAPGNSAGVSTAAAVHFANTPIVGGPTLMIELAGTAAGTAYDQLHVTGPLALGGTLAVSIIEGFTPAAGSSFDILDWGSLSGTFSTIALPTLSGLAWNTSQLYTTGVLSVLAAGLAGDYNQNGVVDAADYVVWRNGLGTTYTQNDYTVWRANFGRTAGAGSVVGAAVPEPDSLALAGVLLSSVIMARRGAKARIRSADWSACFLTMGGLAMRSIALLATTSLAFLVGENVAFAQAGDQLVTLCFRNRTIQVPFYLVSRYTANGATIGPCPTSTTSWLFNGTGDWFVSGNWSRRCTGAATNAQINNGGTAQIVDASAAARNFSLGNMFEGGGTLEVLGGAAAFNDIDVGLVAQGRCRSAMAARCQLPLMELLAMALSPVARRRYMARTLSGSTSAALTWVTMAGARWAFKTAARFPTPMAISAI